MWILPNDISTTFSPGFILYPLTSILSSLSQWLANLYVQRMPLLWAEEQRAQLSTRHFPMYHSTSKSIYLKLNSWSNSLTHFSLMSSVCMSSNTSCDTPETSKAISPLPYPPHPNERQELLILLSKYLEDPSKALQIYSNHQSPSKHFLFPGPLQEPLSMFILFQPHSPYFTLSNLLIYKLNNAAPL